MRTFLLLLHKIVGGFLAKMGQLMCYFWYKVIPHQVLVLSTNKFIKKSPGVSYSGNFLMSLNLACQFRNYNLCFRPKLRWLYMELMFKISGK